MAKLVLVRHAQASLFAADYDELSPQGRDQARCLGEWWARRDFRFTSAITGPARRHRDTAALAAEAVHAKGTPWPSTQMLAEFDEHDGLALMKAAVPYLSEQDADLKALADMLFTAVEPAAKSQAFQRVFERVMTEWLAGTSGADEVETWPAFRQRVIQGLASVRQDASQGQVVVVFTSVGPIAVVLQQALGLDPLGAFRVAWRVRNCSVTEFVFDDARLTLDRFNDVAHLSPSLVTFR